MDDPLAPSGGRVDVGRVMDAVRDAVLRRRNEPTTPVEEAVAARLAELADESGIDPELLGHLLAADGLWNLAPDYRIETHRSGLEARAVVLLKKVVRPFVRLYTDPIVTRQAQVNLYLLHVLRSLLTEITRLQRELAEREKAAPPGP